MKAIAATALLSSCLFGAMMLVSHVAGLNQNIAALAIASLILGSSAYALGAFYLHQTRLGPRH
ncbi:hypothetical protein [Lysobacter rhizosphaerae]